MQLQALSIASDFVCAAIQRYR